MNLPRKYNTTREYQSIIASVFDFCCTTCKKYLTHEERRIHHVVPANMIEQYGAEKIHNIKNIMLLCHPCHTAIHKRDGIHRGKVKPKSIIKPKRKNPYYDPTSPKYYGLKYARLNAQNSEKCLGGSNEN
jgi:5-methylcytosine-specific restriction endonuclease McrA